MPHITSLISQGTKPISHCDTSLESIFADICFQTRTLFLFTGDQILDTVIPGTAFGIMAALSGPILDLPYQCSLSVLSRVPQVSLWLWLVILQFCVQNQRSAESVAEDLVNKPWRPIASGRIARKQADNLLLVTTLFTTALSYQVNVMPIFVVYVCLITVYNDHGGGNKSGIVRNAFCGAGFTCYFSGALSIAIGPEITMSHTAWKWAVTLAMGVLLTTIQTQEFRDEAGDRVRRRRTLVTEFGRKPALWTVFLTVAFWSIYIPRGFFTGSLTTTILPALFGGALVASAAQAYDKSNNKLDRRMYKLWCLWIFSFCPLPLLARILA